MFKTMKTSKVRLYAIALMTAIMSIGILSVAPMQASAAKILSDCTKSGYYMMSPENILRADTQGEKIGNLAAVQVVKIDNKKIITDKKTNLKWIKLTGAAVKNSNKKQDGYICLSYCYYMGDDSNRKTFEIANTAPAMDSFYSDSHVVAVLNEGDKVNLIATNDAQLYSPEKKYWVNACDLKTADNTGSSEDMISYDFNDINGTDSPYVDYNAMDYSCNDGAFCNENQRVIYLHFIAKGMPETSAAAIAVNAYNESGCDPSAWCYDTNGLISYGLFQWNGGRYDSLRNWCIERNYDYSDLYAQLEYLDWELENCYTYVNDVMYSEMTAGDAAYFWAAKFEVCSSAYWNRRAAEADSLYSCIKAID